MSSGVEITVTGVTKRGVRLALRVPDDVTVLRGEVIDAVAAANVAAVEASAQGGSEEFCTFDDWR